MQTLAYILNTNGAISGRELEENFPEFDRVTLYRTIQSFVDKGILHPIPDDGGVARYGICSDTCGPNTHNHNHIHFKCKECGRIECLERPVNIQIELSGYQIEEIQTIVQGTCNKCTV